MTLTAPFHTLALDRHFRWWPFSEATRAKVKRARLGAASTNAAFPACRAREARGGPGAPWVRMVDGGLLDGRPAGIARRLVPA
jgi:hypothetical protein